MRRQIDELKRNQQMQIDYLARHDRMEKMLNGLLLVCLALASALVWSLWRIVLSHRQQAMEDPLTGLKNRRFLQKYMEIESQRMRRSEQSALLLMVDIDHFKAINDHYGHSTGDCALVQLADALRSCVRNSDVVSRWGGEEFVIVCVNSTDEHLEVICNRIRQRLQRVPIHCGEHPPFSLSLSVGASVFCPSATNELWEAALGRADHAMYAVKHSGRDGWSLAEPAEAPAARVIIQ